MQIAAPAGPLAVLPCHRARATARRGRRPPAHPRNAKAGRSASRVHGAALQQDAVVEARGRSGWIQRDGSLQVLFGKLGVVVVVHNTSAGRCRLSSELGCVRCVCARVCVERGESIVALRFDSTARTPSNSSFQAPICARTCSNGWFETSVMRARAPISAKIRGNAAVLRTLLRH